MSLVLLEIQQRREAMYPTGIPNLPDCYKIPLEETGEIVRKRVIFITNNL